MDPLSIAGLVLAVIDDLVKIGDRAVELIETARKFDDDSRQFRNLIDIENTRTRLLRNLLFSKASIYDGQTLFDQFDGDIQRQIELLLGQLKSTLQQACDLLERRYGVLSNTPEGQKSTTSLTDLVKWSWRDKKVVESIIAQFKSQNDYVHNMIKMWCLASQIGVNPQHLLHLQQDASAVQLGFDRDAALRLQVAQMPQTSLEIGDNQLPSELQKIIPTANSGMFALVQIGDRLYLQENHVYDGPLGYGHGQSSASDIFLDGRTRQRVELLAQLLHQPKEQVFRIPKCVGWKFLSQQSSIAFLFDAEGHCGTEPVSLLRLIHSGENPELGDKYRLALGLAKCMSQLHMVQWVHENFRSENVIFLPSFDAEKNTSQVIRYDEPWVLGFSSSRPEKFWSNGPADFLPHRDIYRHPDRQGVPEERFSKVHDIYALGVALLEIGLWQPALSLQSNNFVHARNAQAVKNQLIKHANKRLDRHVGRKYKEIVVKCLEGDFGVTDDTKEDLKLQQAFRTQIVDVLEKAADSVG